MANDDDKHEERLLTGVVVAFFIFITMGGMQVATLIAAGLPQAETFTGWLTWKQAFLYSAILWPTLYLTGWLITDGLPLLHLRYEKWAKGESEDAFASRR